MADKLRCGVRTSKHDKACQSITKLELEDNQVGDDGAKALADAVKALLVKLFRRRCGQPL